MGRILLEHLVGVLLVAGVFLWLLVNVTHNAASIPTPSDNEAQQYLLLDFIDFGSPLDRALFKETLDAFFPGRAAKNDSLVLEIDRLRREQFTTDFYKTGAEERGLTREKLERLALMYLKFIVIYIVVMGLCYYGAETIGTLRFVQMRQGRSSYMALLAEHAKNGRLLSNATGSLGLLAKAIVKGFAYLILFAPAYVIAYSFKTKFDTDSYIFVVGLGVISNGLLINYANRFFTLLVAESRKGYVETALAKNLRDSYQWNVHDGLTLRSILRFKKQFPSHVFQHIYVNAHFQFVPTLKEFASFLITGLVIIEMALNIQGHLSYEMLKNILFRQYDVVLIIILGIFLLVKATEIAVDIRTGQLLQRFENRTT